MSTLKFKICYRREGKAIGTAERRNRILKILCRRRHETISNLAFEIGVSVRTIRRDIEILSLTEPIYTQTGRYGGGVYVLESYSTDKMYATDKEIQLLKKLYTQAESQAKCLLSSDELLTLKKMISKYSKPIKQ